MNKAAFPTRRSDGSFAVAARYSVTDAALQNVIRDYVDQWIREKPDGYRTRLRRELVTDPHIISRGKGLIDVVFEARPSSRLWKGYLVELSAQVPHISGIAFEGLWDLVSGEAHPGTVRRKLDDDNWPTRPL